MPRITIDIDERTHKALGQIPYGLRHLTYKRAIEELARALKHNHHLVADIVSGRIALYLDHSSSQEKSEKGK